MPIVHVKLTPDKLTPEIKAQIVERMTQVLVDLLQKNPESTMVLIEEVATDNWGIGGQTVTARRKARQAASS